MVTMEDMVTMISGWNGFVESDYNENTDDELCFFCNDFKVGGAVYLYADNTWSECEIIAIKDRASNPQAYDEEDEEVLVRGEEEYDADTSAEFIADDNCYLVWLRYVWE